MSTPKPHIMIAEARFYSDLADYLAEGAEKALIEAGATYEKFSVAGALEIAPLIKMAAQRKSDPFDAYIALGTVIRGETSHYDIVCNESARALTWLGIDPGLLIGNGILTCETHEQAFERAHPGRMNKGGFAAKAVLELVSLRDGFRGA